MQQVQRFHALDGLRGIAALAVMLFHVGDGFIDGGYLAVDFFLCLSGFVIALSYGERLRGGMGLARFMQLRLARLYPMIFLGGVLAVVLHEANPNMLLLVPDIHGVSLFPANPPFWSLLMELFAYLAFALVLVRMRLAGLLAVMALSGGVLAFAVSGAPDMMEFGARWHTLDEGAARAIFSFTAGAAMHRVWSARPRERRVSRAALLLPAALLALLFFAPEDRRLWDLFCVVVALPLIAWLAIGHEMPGKALWEKLGDASYPLYCIHMPILYWATQDETARLAVALALIPAALLLERWYERPVRRWLARAVQQRAARLQPA